MTKYQLTMGSVGFDVGNHLGYQLGSGGETFAHKNRYTQAGKQNNKCREHYDIL